jgi:hypothetical protein
MNDPEAPAPSTRPSRLGSFLVFMLLLAVVALLAYDRFGPVRVEQWQYMIVAPDDAQFDQQMNQLGRDGWELVSARRATSGSGYLTSASYEMILKRPVGR